MRPNAKKKNENQSFAIAAGTGIGVCLVISILLSMLLAVMVANERLSENTIELLVPVITMIGSLFGCLIAGKRYNEKLAILSCAVGAGYLFIVAAAGILFFDGGFHNIGIRLLATVLGCVISCAICIRGKGSNRKRKRAYR